MGKQERPVQPRWIHEPKTYDWKEENATLRELDRRYEALNSRLKLITPAPGYNSAKHSEDRNAARLELNRADKWATRAGINIDPSPLTPFDKMYDIDECFSHTRRHLDISENLIGHLEREVGISAGLTQEEGLIH